MRRVKKNGALYITWSTNDPAIGIKYGLFSGIPTSVKAMVVTTSPRNKTNSITVATIQHRLKMVGLKNGIQKDLLVSITEFTNYNNSVNSLTLHN